MLKNNPGKLKLVSSLQGPLEQCGVPKGITSWILSNLDLLKLQTHALVNELIKNRREHAEEYLTLSTRVIIGGAFEDFFDSYEVNRHWIIESRILFDNIAALRYSDSVDLEYLEELFDKLCIKSIKASFLKRKE